MKAWIIAGLFAHERVANGLNAQSVQQIRIGVSIMMLYEQGRVTFILVETFRNIFCTFITYYIDVDMLVYMGICIYIWKL